MDGRKSRNDICEFGGCVMYMPADALDKPNLHSRWLHGVWRGIRAETDDTLIGTTACVFKARSIKRKVFEHRWDAKQIKDIAGFPWKPCPTVSDDAVCIGPPGPTQQPPREATDAELEGQEKCWRPAVSE